MKFPGPALLFSAWVLHDVEEAIAFPSTCDNLANLSGIEQLRIGKGQSWAAVGLMGIVVATACWQGHNTRGHSRLYRAVLAGLEAHVYTHLAASAVQRRYTAGVATAVPIMLPGAIAARRELQRSGIPLRARDVAMGASLLIPAAIVSQALARLVFRPRRGGPRK